jgi:UDP-glucose:(heptosyl)LPS alpha-1,3-glucosyltransferase
VKIAYIVHDYHRAGGQSRYVAELATRFADRHEVHVFANGIERNGAKEAKIHFHSVPAWRANALTTVLSFALPATFQVGRGFDIIHSQGFCGFRGNVYTGHICNRAWHLALKMVEGGATLRESIFDAVATTLEHVVYRFTRHGRVIAISQRVARDLARFYHCRAPIRVIHHGVDLELFSPESRLRGRATARAQYGLTEEEIAFLYVGDLRKGASRCIQALALLDSGILMFTSRSDVAAYRSLAEKLGVQDRVRFLGPTNHVENVYAAADALLLPTPYDAFAMVVSEAMACGLPVIVSREAGASELIEDGINGLTLQDVGSYRELAEKMQLLRDDRSLAEELGRAARKTVEPLSWDAVASQTMQVYEQVVGERA